MYEWLLLLLLAPVILATEQNPGTYEVREHTLTRPYPNVFSTSYSHWHLIGNTMVTDRYIRLTADVQSQAGGLWNSIPVSYPDWEMHVNFKVHGTGKQFFGDGFAIWYVKDPKLTGPMFGYRDYFSGLAIVMDTYSNQNGTLHNIHPFISAIINNGTLHYDHNLDGSNILTAGCSSPFRQRDTDTVVAVRYQNNRLTVSSDLEGKNVWIQCFAIDDVHLPTFYHLGFSAATGELSDNHDIISVHTYRLETSGQRLDEDRQGIVPSAPSARDYKERIEIINAARWTAWKIFFRVIFLLVICLVGSFAAYYQMKRRRYYHTRLY